MDTEQEEYDESSGFSYQTESSVPLRITVNKIKRELPVNLFGLDVSIQLNEIDKKEKTLRKKKEDFIEKLKAKGAEFFEEKSSHGVNIIIAKREEDSDFLSDIDYEITKSIADWFEIMLPTFSENRSLMNLPFSKMNALKARILTCAQEVDPDLEESDAKKKATESTQKSIEEPVSMLSEETDGA